MFPPKIAWMPAPKFPMMERERTMMPRTTPKDFVTRKPGSSNVVVVNGCVRFIRQRLNTTPRGGKSEKFLRREKRKRRKIPQHGKNCGDNQKHPQHFWRNKLSGGFALKMF